MRVLVCGGRTFGSVPNFTPPEHWAAAKAKADAERMHFWSVMAPYADVPDLVIIQGGASGADRCARDWADGEEDAAELLTFEAEWKRFGNRAGPLRNQRMLDEGKPDLVVAFPGGRGTADMVRRAKAAGVKVIEISSSREPGNG